MSLIKFIALIPVVLIGLVVLVFIYTELNKAYWDYRVKQMCEKDGGVEIFEHIDVTAEEFSKLPKLGKGIGFRSKKFAVPSDIIFSENRDLILHSHFPRVEYSEITIKQLTDKKIIARYITAARVGGDFPSLAHSSSYRCPSSVALGFEIKKIFKIKENK